MSENNLKNIFHYSGSVNYKVHEELITQIKLLTEEQNLKPATKQKLISIAIELVENIYKHASKNSSKKFSNNEYFAIDSIDDKLIITAGNMINRSNSSLVSSKINELNKSCKDDLKQEFKETITNGKISDKNGAGLGLIIIALKSENEIIYDIEKINDEFSFMELTISIKK